MAESCENCQIKRERDFLLERRGKVGCFSCKHNSVFVEGCGGSCFPCKFDCPCAGCIDNSKWELEEGFEKTEHEK